jgi:predicted amidophosphoribosyltransferase
MHCKLLRFMHKYYPYWCQQNGHKFRSPLFDEYSNMILKLKEREVSAIGYFYSQLKPLAHHKTAIVVVPSHDPERKDSGIHDLAKLMCKNGLWLDAIDCLQRTRKIPKLASGGSRSILAHLNSIEVVNPEIIQDRVVFLLDDVSTTGNTFTACKMLLAKAGAKATKTHALGETYLQR